MTSSKLIYKRKTIVWEPIHQRKKKEITCKLNKRRKKKSLPKNMHRIASNCNNSAKLLSTKFYLVRYFRIGTISLMSQQNTIREKILLLPFLSL